MNIEELYFNIDGYKYNDPSVINLFTLSSNELLFRYPFKYLILYLKSLLSQYVM